MATSQHEEFDLDQTMATINASIDRYEKLARYTRDFRLALAEASTLEDLEQLQERFLTLPE